MKTTAIAIIALTALGACGNSGQNTPGKFNPLALLNSAKDPAAEAPVERAVKADGKVDVALVSNLRLDYTRSGAIIRAQAVIPGPGFHSPSLRAVNFGQADETGTIRYEFRVQAPSFAENGPEQSISAATFIPHSRLRPVNTIIVSSPNNEASVRLR